MNKKAFTMIEVVFVIVILGILAAVALPKFSTTRTDAQISKGRADVATIRSAIVSERQSQLIKGTSSYIPKLSTSSSATTLFTGDGTRTLLMYGITAGTTSGHWKITSDTEYKYIVGSIEVPFTYASGTGIFTCNSSAETTGASCALLVN